MAANQDKSMMPLTFDLPDGDVVELCTWPFVMYKLNELLDPLKTLLTAENESLNTINEKLISWAPEDEEES